MRDANAVHLRRTTVTNHSSIVEKRKADAKKNRLARLHKMKEDNAKHTEKVIANEEAVYKVLK